MIDNNDDGMSENVMPNGTTRPNHNTVMGVLSQLAERNKKSDYGCCVERLDLHEPFGL